MSRRAFSLVELLVVIAIIALLSAIIFPVFATVRGRARQTACLSNLRQIGTAAAMYVQDYDGRFPYGVDASDRDRPDIWASQPAFEAQIPTLPLVQTILQPYLRAPEIFHCPSDTGFTTIEFTGFPLDATPTSFEKFGSSYYYRTEVAALGINESAVQTPAQINFFFDGAGRWHGTFVPRALRYNMLYLDGHAKNVSSRQMDEAWATPLN